MYLLALESAAAAKGRQQAPATMCWLTRVGTSTPNQLNQQIREYRKWFFLYKKVKTKCNENSIFSTESQFWSISPCSDSTNYTTKNKVLTIGRRR
jgi:hypothetical protein